MGCRADVRVDSSVSAPRRAVRAAGGHSSWLPETRRVPDLPLLHLKGIVRCSYQDRKFELSVFESRHEGTHRYIEFFIQKTQKGCPLNYSLTFREVQQEPGNDGKT